MSTKTQVDITTRSARIRADVWEAARTEAFSKRTSIAKVVDIALRRYFKLKQQPESARAA